MKYCPNCAFDLTDVDGMFCPNCGTKIEKEPEVQVQVVKKDTKNICPDCGYDISDVDGMFCPNCGAALRKSAPPKNQHY